MINYKSYLIFLFASLAVSIGLQMLLPFPYGLGAALALFIAFPILLRRRMMNRMRGGSSGSSGGLGGLGGLGGGLFGQNNENSTKIKYECLVCHKVYNASIIKHNHTNFKIILIILPSWWCISIHIR